MVIVRNEFALKCLTRWIVFSMLLTYCLVFIVVSDADTDYIKTFNLTVTLC